MFEKSELGGNNRGRNVLSLMNLSPSINTIVDQLLSTRIGAYMALAGVTANLGDIKRQITKAAEPIKAPLVLISQVHRSGGTLLSQLFDGHSKILAHPLELKIGYPSKTDWPPLRCDSDPKRTFRHLFERDFVQLMRNGYTKGRNRANPHHIFFVPNLQKQLFVRLWTNSPPKLQRDILNYYFTSFFKAWLNYRGIPEQGTLITAFVPRLGFSAENVEQYFSAYPEGTLISIIRDPMTWYPSAKRHGNHKKQRMEDVLQVWHKSADSIARNKERFGDRVQVIKFEDLVGNTEATMRLLAQRLALDFEPVLTMPTFNGAPMVANTSFDFEAPGIVQATLSRDRLLDGTERQRIYDSCYPVYETMLGYCETPQPP